MGRMVVIAMMVLFAGLAGVSIAAPPADSPEVRLLVGRLSEAIARNDEPLADRLADELFMLVTGNDPARTDGFRPVTDEDIGANCRFQRALAPLVTDAMLASLRDDFRLLAFSVVHFQDAEGLRLVNGMATCGAEEGDRWAQAVRDSLDWKTRLKGGASFEAREMAREYEILLAQHPDRGRYRAMRDLVRGEADEIERREVAEIRSSTGRATGQREEMERAWRVPRLVLARSGDTRAQLDLAHAYEVGSPISMNARSAYYWYRRAAANGGGQIAADGSIRTRRLIAESDADLVQLWLDKRFLPAD